MRPQRQGLAGLIVDQMIRRTVRARFHRVHWIPPEGVPPGPVIWAANHHGWHDGYLMYHVVTILERPSLDWITEFDAFPAFRYVGGMPFPEADAAARAATIRRTITAMRAGQSLILFPEGHLHPPPALLPFGRSVELLARHVPDVTVVPVAIRYEAAMHERPEAFITFGEPVPRGESLAARLRLAVGAELDAQAAAVRHSPERFRVLAQGTRDVNERWGFHRRKREVA